MGSKSYAWIPATQAVPFQFAYEPSPRTMCWPATQFVFGEAVLPVIAARFAGGVAPAGTQAPGTPAMAPVAAMFTMLVTVAL